MQSMDIFHTWQCKSTLVTNLSDYKKIRADVSHWIEILTLHLQQISLISPLREYHLSGFVAEVSLDTLFRRLRYLVHIAFVTLRP